MIRDPESFTILLDTLTRFVREKLIPREVEVTDLGVERLRKGFDQLAASPLSSNRPLVMNLLKTAFANHIPDVDTKKNTKKMNMKVGTMKRVQRALSMSHENTELFLMYPPMNFCKRYR